MPRFFAIALLFMLALVFTACPGHRTPPQIPDNFALRFAVENRMNAPVTVSIRNYYRWLGWDYALSTRGDWICATLEYLEAVFLSNRPTGEFVLMDLDLTSAMIIHPGVSSFELRIETPGETIYLAGHESEDPRFQKTGLCHLDIRIWPGTIGIMLYTRRQIVRFEMDHVLPVKLVVNEDGTVSFLEEMVSDGEGILILGRWHNGRSMR